MTRHGHFGHWCEFELCIDQIELPEDAIASHKYACPVFAVIVFDSFKDRFRNRAGFSSDVLCQLWHRISSRVCYTTTWQVNQKSHRLNVFAIERRVPVAMLARGFSRRGVSIYRPHCVHCRHSSSSSRVLECRQRLATG